MSPHICILTSAHPIDDVRVHSKIASSFLSRGYKVSWVGPDSSLFSNAPRPDDRISYHLAPAVRTKLDRLTSLQRVVGRAREVDNVDWYYSPDPDAVEAALKLARGSNAKVLFDIHEIYHGALLDRWVLGRKANRIRKYVRERIARSCTRSDLVTAVSDSVMQAYAADLPNAVVARNCAPKWFANREGFVEPSGEPNILRVMHGRAVPNNGTTVVLDALAQLPKGTDVQVVMFPRAREGGAFLITDFERRTHRLGVSASLDLREGVAHSDMPPLMQTCAVGMIAYGRDLGIDSLPNRFFEYMAAGLAVLTPTYSSEMKRIVETEQIGLCVDAENPAEISQALSWFSDHPEETREMGARAREAFLLRHHWESEFDRLLAAMANL